MSTELAAALDAFVSVRTSLIAAHNAAHIATRSSVEAHVWYEAREMYLRIGNALIAHDEQGKRVFGESTYVDAVLDGLFPAIA